MRLRVILTTLSLAASLTRALPADTFLLSAHRTGGCPGTGTPLVVEGANLACTPFAGIDSIIGSVRADCSPDATEGFLDFYSDASCATLMLPSPLIPTLQCIPDLDLPSGRSGSNMSLTLECGLPTAPTPQATPSAFPTPVAVSVALYQDDEPGQCNGIPTTTLPPSDDQTCVPFPQRSGNPFGVVVSCSPTGQEALLFLYSNATCLESTGTPTYVTTGLCESAVALGGGSLIVVCGARVSRSSTPTPSLSFGASASNTAAAVRPGAGELSATPSSTLSLGASASSTVRAGRAIAAVWGDAHICSARSHTSPLPRAPTHPRLLRPPSPMPQRAVPQACAPPCSRRS